MKPTIEPRLPAATREALDGTRADARPLTAMLVCSAAPGGEPNIALVSRGEVLALTEETLRIALHADSRTTSNLGRSGRATLLLADASCVETIGLRTRPLGRHASGEIEVQVFEATVTEVRAHQVPYASVTSGITFELADPPSTVRRWERTLALLREAA